MMSELVFVRHQVNRRYQLCQLHAPRCFGSVSTISVGMVHTNDGILGCSMVGFS